MDGGASCAPTFPNRRLQELTNMILDGELAMGDEYVNDHLEMKEVRESGLIFDLSKV